MMKIIALKIANHSKYICLAICSYIMTITLLFGAQEAYNNIGIYVLPDRVVKRTDTAIFAEYIQGMPIYLSVRLVNLDIKKMKTNAVPIKLPQKWSELIVFEVASVKTDEKIACSARKINSQSDSGLTNTEVIIDRNDVMGTWLIDSNAVCKLGTGEFRITTGFASKHATPITINIIKPIDDRSLLQINIRKASSLSQEGRFAEAIVASEEIMKRNGRDARDGEVYALLIAADAYEKTQNYKNALDAYQEYLSIWKSRNLRGEPQKVMWHIDNLRNKITSEIIQGIPKQSTSQSATNNLPPH